MTKKLIFASLIASCFIISCSDENTEISSIENSVSKQGTSNKTSPNTSISYPVFLRTGELSSSNPDVSSNIVVNPNYDYYSDYNVYAGDDYYADPTPNCLGDGKPCINLSHFLGMKGASIAPDYLPVGNQVKVAISYGEAEYNDLYLPKQPKVTGPYTTGQTSFTISEYGYYSPIFANSTYMTNDAANSVLHQFKDMVATIPNDDLGRAPKIYAVNFRYRAWYGNPPGRQAIMSIKYYYN